MRDPKRIPRILGVLGEVWAQSPDLRLGQLILNLNVNYQTEDPQTEQRLLEQLHRARSRAIEAAEAAALKEKRDAVAVELLAIADPDHATGDITFGDLVPKMQRIVDFLITSREETKP